MTAPLLSVVVTVVDGGDALERCLAALARQTDAPPFEVLVPYDSTTAAVPGIIRAVGTGGPVPFRGLDLGRLPTRRPAGSPAGQHELIDRRRAGGLAAAAGALIALLEDRSIAREDWAATVASLHRDLPHAVIGGAVENGVDRRLNWMVFYCDFGRYEPPFAEGTRRFVSDVNVTYKRRALDATRDLWRDRYHEPIIHWALQRGGESVFASPRLVVRQVRAGLTMRGLVRERVAWGHLFGSLRMRDASVVRKAAFVMLSPAAPLVLFARFLRDRILKRAPPGRTLAAAPGVMVLLAAWAAGEVAGCFDRER